MGHTDWVLLTSPVMFKVLLALPLMAANPWMEEPSRGYENGR